MGSSSLRLIYKLASQARRLKKLGTQANSVGLWNANKVYKWEKHQGYNGVHRASTSSANPSSSLKAVLPQPTESASWVEGYITLRKQGPKIQPLPTFCPANDWASNTPAQGEFIRPYVSINANLSTFLGLEHWVIIGFLLVCQGKDWHTVRSWGHCPRLKESKRSIWKNIEVI